MTKASWLKSWTRALTAAGALAVLCIVGAQPAGAAGGQKPCVVKAVAGRGPLAASDSPCCPDGSKAVGKVTSSNGQFGAPKAGSYVCAGDHVGGPFAQFSVMTPSGAKWTFKPGDSGTFLSGGGLNVQGGDSFEGDYEPPPGTFARSAAAGATLPDLQATTPGGTTGVYAPAPGHSVSFTLSVLRGGGSLFHVMSGRGFATSAGGQRTLQIPAGEGARLQAQRVWLTLAWPAGAQSAVPPGQRPPAIEGLRFRGGARPAVSFRLSRAAAVTVSLARRGRALTRDQALRRGGHTVRLGRLAAGRYLLTVRAVDGQGRTTVVQRRITRR